MYQFFLKKNSVIFFILKWCVAIYIKCMQNAFLMRFGGTVPPVPWNFVHSTVNCDVFDFGSWTARSDIFVFFVSFFLVNLHIRAYEFSKLPQTYNFIIRYDILYKCTHTHESWRVSKRQSGRERERACSIPKKYADEISRLVHSIYKLWNQFQTYTRTHITLIDSCNNAVYFRSLGSRKREEKTSVKKERRKDRNYIYFKCL